jgi:predicted Rossmann fold flavoprotein
VPALGRADLERADVVIVGAGAAGLMCAGIAAQRGRRVILLEHTRTIGAKILISGGGRCNFTNLDVRPDRFLSDNRHFAKSALARYTQSDFIALVKKYAIPFYEKTLGQLFCEGAGSAQRIVDLLLAEAAGVDVCTSLGVSEISRRDQGFVLSTPVGEISAPSVVIATGGLSIPKLGGTDFAYRVAQQFQLPIIGPRPALVPLTFAPDDRSWMAALAGVSLEAIVSHGKAAFREGLLFTHRGLSGPSILQISSYWRHGDAIIVNALPDTPPDYLIAQKAARPRQTIGAALAALLPERLAQHWLSTHAKASGVIVAAPLADQKDANLLRFLQGLQALTLTPAGDEGYAKAEVTAGGIDTKALDQKTMQVKTVPGLYFIGECVDVTGWLGGYNFQWAWSSGWVAGQAV